MPFFFFVLTCSQGYWCKYFWPAGADYEKMNRFFSVQKTPAYGALPLKQNKGARIAGNRTNHSFDDAPTYFLIRAFSRCFARVMIPEIEGKISIFAPTGNLRRTVLIPISAWRVYFNLRLCHFLPISPTRHMMCSNDHQDDTQPPRPPQNVFSVCAS